MTTKFNILKSAIIAASISAGIAVAYAFQPAKVADDSHQVVITAQKYEVLNRTCNETCIATVKANDYNIYVEYALDGGSVEFLDILNVVRHDETVNAYVDRYEIEKINAAIERIAQECQSAFSTEQLKVLQSEQVQDLKAEIEMLKAQLKKKVPA